MQGSHLLCQAQEQVNMAFSSSRDSTLSGEETWCDCSNNFRESTGVLFLCCFCFYAVICMVRWESCGMVRNSGGSEPFLFFMQVDSPTFCLQMHSPNLLPISDGADTSSLSSGLKWDCLVWLRTLDRVLPGKGRSA